jgi:hypothetical protein
VTYAPPARLSSSRSPRRGAAGQWVEINRLVCSYGTWRCGLRRAAAVHDGARATREQAGE